MALAYCLPQIDRKTCFEGHLICCPMRLCHFLPYSGFFLAAPPPIWGLPHLRCGGYPFFPRGTNYGGGHREESPMGGHRAIVISWLTLAVRTLLWCGQLWVPSKPPNKSLSLNYVGGSVGANPPPRQGLGDFFDPKAANIRVAHMGDGLHALHI